MTVTPAIPQRRHSTLDLIFRPGEDADVLLTVLSAEAGKLGRALHALPPQTRDVALKEVRSAAVGLLDIDLIDLLIAGWRQERDLTSAARRTLKVHGSSELVRLGTHRVQAAREPSVKVLVNGRLIATVQFSVSVVFEVTALLAGISAGLLVEVHAGRCDLTATLAIDGVEVASGQASLELPGAVPVTPGVRLLPPEEYPAGTDEAPAEKLPAAAGT